MANHVQSACPVCSICTQNTVALSSGMLGHLTPPTFFFGGESDGPCRLRRGRNAEKAVFAREPAVVFYGSQITVTVRGLCSGCTGNLNVQFMFKKPLYYHIHIQSRLLHWYALIYISIDFKRISNSSPCAVAAALLRSLCCRAIRKAGFQTLLLVLWCLHLGSLLHTCTAEPPRGQVEPSAWYPAVGSKQGSCASGQHAGICIFWRDFF